MCSGHCHPGQMSRVPPFPGPWFNHMGLRPEVIKDSEGWTHSSAINYGPDVPVCVWHLIDMM